MKTYNTVADIYAANDETRRRIVARVSTLDEAQQTYRPTADAWTVVEIVEHLAHIERRLGQMLGMMLRKAEGAAAETNAAAAADAAAQTGAAAETSAAAQTSAAPRPMQPFSLAEFAAQARDRKFVAPEEVRPRGDVALADALAQLAESRAALTALQPRFEATDVAGVHYPHPSFGPLNAYQWLAFIGVHEARHLQQIERVLTAQAEG